MSEISTSAKLHVDVERMRRKHEVSLELEAELDVAWLAAALADTDATARAPGTVTLELSLQADRVVLVRGRLEAGFEVPCARCLEPAAVDAATEVCVTYGVDPVADEGAEDLEPDPEAADAWTYDGHGLDLGPMLAEQVALAYPMRALCPRGEACRGLCSSCGADLNRQIGGTTRCAACGAALAGGPGAGGAEPDTLPEAEVPAWQRALRKLRSS